MIPPLKKGDKVVIVGCSNGLSPSQNIMAELIEQLEQYGLLVEIKKGVYRDLLDYHIQPTIRATMLYESLVDEEVRAVFDVTGGDIANEVLDAMTFEQWGGIRQRQTPQYVVAYSDNSVILNVLLQYEPYEPVYFQVQHIVKDTSRIAQTQFERLFLKGEDVLPTLPYQAIVGGNLRCFLKLAGTSFIPEISKNKTLLIEGASGGIERFRTYLAQLSLMGVLSSIDTLIVGRFSQLYEEGKVSELFEVINRYAKQQNFSVMEAGNIGHHWDAYPMLYRRDRIMSKKRKSCIQVGN